MLMVQGLTELTWLPTSAKCDGHKTPSVPLCLSLQFCYSDEARSMVNLEYPATVFIAGDLKIMTQRCSASY